MSILARISKKTRECGEVYDDAEYGMFRDCFATLAMTVVLLRWDVRSAHLNLDVDTGGEVEICERFDDLLLRIYDV